MTDDLHLRLSALVDDLPPLPSLPSSVAARGRRRRSTKLAGLALGISGAVLVVPLVVGGSDDRLEPEQFAPPSPFMSASPAASPAVSAPPAALTRVDLVAEGLRLTSGSSSRALDFGVAEDQVVRALTAVLRDPAERADLRDCGPTTIAVSFGRFTAYVVDGLFQGWRSGDAGLSTADGITVGSTLAEVRAARPDMTLAETTLGTEVTTGGVSGLVEDGVVTSLSAGQACAFR